MHRPGDPEDPGSSPTTASWQFPTTAKWQKITHMLPWSSISHNLSDFGQKEDWRAAYAMQESYIMVATLNKISPHH